ncbi:hypothetical protein AMECASPLE_019053 [Ameca splendens]|uniref:Uncharacterized protein n=1 Tax=Ameca splendens TaxID=208324 RepID=A0ABV0ZP16_9TELE
MPVTSFLTRCRRSPEIWRLTDAAYLVLSHGAIKGRTASISAADCFAPVVLLYASLLWFRRISGIPTDRKLHRTSYLAGSLNRSVYRSSRKSCPPLLKGLFPWLLPTLFSGSALGPDASSPWRIPTPHHPARPSWLPDPCSCL